MRKLFVVLAGTGVLAIAIGAYHLGRADQDGGAGAFRGLDELAAGLSVESTFNVRSVDLMRTQPPKDGGRYVILHRAKLSGD